MASVTTTTTATANPEPFAHFAEFIAGTRNKYKGHDIAGNEHHYVPWSELNEYWKPARIRRVLQAFDTRIDVNVDVIREHYLRIFSTLVYTGPQAVRNFQRTFVRLDLRDEKLPLRARPDSWPDEKFYKDIFNEISPIQWQFFPLLFTRHNVQDCHIEDKRILPIDAPEYIAHGTYATVERIIIHDEHNHLEPRNLDGHPPTRDFVVKTYHNKKYEGLYENELRAYLRLNSTSSSSNVVKFFGSFRQLDSYSLLLEYVDGGNLGEFFDNTPPPATSDDTAEFWVNLLQVLNGLDRIHQLMHYDEDDIIRGIHEDIRPENILLMKGPSGSPYDFVPKIADFGLYSRVRTAKAKASGSMGLDQCGSQRYSAPECSRHTIQRGKAINMITTLSDIFSFGAVLSHTAAWVVGGISEQQSYFKARTAYHDTRVSRFKGSGYEGCFHDSTAPIPTISQQHSRFKQKCRQSDNVTPLVLNLVEECMLLGQAGNRIRAGDALEKFMQTQLPPSASSATETPGSPSSPVWSPQETMQSTQNSGSTTTITPITESDPEKPPQRPPIAVLDRIAVPAGSPQSPQTNSALAAGIISNGYLPSESQDSYSSHATTQSTSNPTSSISSFADRVRLNDILDFRSARREGKPVDPATAALVDYLEHNLIGRDQLFFIDDSGSMSEHKQVIGDAFTALACIAKRLDPNQVELVFASKPTKVHKAKRTKRLRELVNKCEYKGEGSLMASRIADLVEHVLIKQLPWRPIGFNVNLLARKKTSVYVFTDGNWGEVHPERKDACGVQAQVQRLITEMQRRNLDPSQVTLHFVRFGDKENGRLRLQRLDDFGRERDGNWDIVDVKHIKGSMRSIMMGALSPAVDDEPEYFGAF